MELIDKLRSIEQEFEQIILCLSRTCTGKQFDPSWIHPKLLTMTKRLDEAGIASAYAERGLKDAREIIDGLVKDVET